MIRSRGALTRPRDYRGMHNASECGEYAIHSREHSDDLRQPLSIGATGSYVLAEGRIPDVTQA
jgi:hypothetical protein